MSEIGSRRVLPEKVVHCMNGASCTDGMIVLTISNKKSSAFGRGSSSERVESALRCFFESEQAEVLNDVLLRLLCIEELVEALREHVKYAFNAAEELEARSPGAYKPPPTMLTVTVGDDTEHEVLADETHKQTL